MTKIKGLKKLNKAIAKTISDFGDYKMVCADSFGYYFQEARIDYKVYIDYTDEFFDEFVKERFGYTVEHDFPLSLLHELGHGETGDDIQGQVYDWCQAEKARLQDAMNLTDDINKLKVLYWQYFSLPDEIMATQWAVNYAIKHPHKIKKMWSKAEKAFHKFYAKNNLSIEEIVENVIDN